MMKTGCHIANLMIRERQGRFAADAA